MTDVITRANKARALLEDETLTAAFDAVRDGIRRSMFATTPDQEAVREMLYRCDGLLESVRRNLEIFVEDGELKEFQLEQEKRPSHLGDILSWRKKP